jgi:hypothetical protein
MIIYLNLTIAVNNPNDDEPAYKPKAEKKKVDLKKDDSDEEEYSYKPQVEEKKEEPAPKKN